MNPRPVSRRLLLRGLGAFGATAKLALPWLESLPAQAGAPAATKGQLAQPPLRLGFLFMPNGVRPDHWTPPGDAEQYPLTPHLQPVADFRQDFLLLENLWNAKTAGRNGHWPKVPAYLSGGYVERSTGRDLDSGGTSIDQRLAAAFGDQTPLPSLELGIESPRTGIDNIGGGFARIYGSYISWRDPHTPVPKEIIPQLAFDRLFRAGQGHISDGDANGAATLSALQRDEQSVLDLVLADARQLRARAGVADKLKLDEYLESVRAVERRLDASLRPQKRWINQGKPPLDRPAAGIPESHQEHVRLMLDILLLAFWSDNTRLATFMFGDAQSPFDYSFLPGVHGNFHGVSHHNNEEEKRSQYEKIINWHMEQLAYFFGRMKQIQEADGTLLDHSLILFGSTLKDGNRHEIENLPLILAGRGNGLVRPGRRLRAPEKTPLCNLYLWMLQSLGVKETQFGDSTGPLKGLA